MRAESISFKRHFAATVFGLINWHAWLPSKKCRILMYHRILEPENEPIPQLPGMYVRPKTFRMHLEYLSKHFKIIPLEELISNFDNKLTFSDKFIALTFDDAWADFKINALPLLREFNAPATLFVPTAFIDSKKLFWNDIIAYTLKNIPNSPSLRKLPDGTLTQKIEHLKSNHRLREEILQNLEIELGNELSEIPPQFLSWSDIKDLANDPLITIGSHSHKHLIATDLSPKEFSEDVKLSLTEFNKQGIEICNTFCYPNQDSSPEHSEALGKLGFDTYLTNYRSDNSFKRIGVHEDVSETKQLLALQLGI